MRFYLLRPVLNRAGGISQDDMGEYPIGYGFIVRAENEQQARILASKLDSDSLVWTRDECTTCVAVSSEGGIGAFVDLASP